MPGVVAAFREIDRVSAAIREVRKQRLGDMTVYTPTIQHEIEEAVEPPMSPVRRFTLIGALLGVTFGYWVAIYSSGYWPLVVGGKAVESWIPYTIIGFEMMVMVGALSTVFGMFIMSRIPKLTHQVGYDPRFSYGDYGIYVECAPERAQATEALMRQHGAYEVRNAR